MSYNRLNYLQKVIDIQNIYLEHKENGVKGEFIYHNYINPIYRICLKTFYNYLALNAKKEYKEVMAKMEQKPEGNP